MIKLVVTDIDGTALRPGQGELEPDFLPLVEKVKQKGIIYCPASGRQIHSIHKLFKNLTQDSYCLCEKDVYKRQVETSINGQKQKFIITGSYSDYMQLGKSARLNPVTDCSDEVMFNYWSIMVNMDTDKTSEELVQILSSQFPEDVYKRQSHM